MSTSSEFQQAVNRQTKVLYRSAFICFLLPFLFLGVFLVDDLLFHRSQILFWNIFLLSMFPFGLLGLLFSILGLVKSRSIRNYTNKTKGYTSLIMGIIVVIGGILGWMLLYLGNS